MSSIPPYLHTPILPYLDTPYLHTLTLVSSKLIRGCTFVGHRLMAKPQLHVPPRDAGVPPTVIQRIIRELRNYMRDPHPEVMIFPAEDNLMFWRLLIKGPDDTPYAGGVFLAYMKFSSNYPRAPPELRFVTKVRIDIFCASTVAPDEPSCSL